MSSGRALRPSSALRRRVDVGASGRRVTFADEIHDQRDARACRVRQRDNADAANFDAGRRCVRGARAHEPAALDTEIGPVVGDELRAACRSGAARDRIFPRRFRRAAGRPRSPVRRTRLPARPSAHAGCVNVHRVHRARQRQFDDEARAAAISRFSAQTAAAGALGDLPRDGKAKAGVLAEMVGRAARCRSARRWSRDCPAECRDHRLRP